MTHEGNHTLSCFVAVKCVQLLGHQGNVLLGILQQGHTELD